LAGTEEAGAREAGATGVAYACALVDGAEAALEETPVEVERLPVLEVDDAPVDPVVVPAAPVDVPAAPVDPVVVPLLDPVLAAGADEEALDPVVVAARVEAAADAAARV
jgi:hypothetical protein